MGRVNGVLLDSTFLIEAERNHYNPFTVLHRVQELIDTQQVGLSSISVMELSHGETRADSTKRAQLREKFLTSILSCVEVFPVTKEIARHAGRRDGQLKKVGISIAAPDLLIGVTALELGFPVLTKNLRHFQKIPGLDVLHHGV